MSWFKKIFGGSERSTELAEPVLPPKPAKAEQQSKPRIISPGRAATKFAKHVPGAVIDNFDNVNPRDDGLLARVTFKHEGVVCRIVMRYYGDSEYATWLETRCIGVFGDFNLEHIVRGEELDNPDAKQHRFFLTRECYVSGPRMRNEVARIRTLAPDVQARLVELGRKVDLVKLDEEVLGVVLGDISGFMDILSDPKKGGRYVLSLGSELLFLAKQFPPMAKDVAELAEARTCRFCNASFIFSPDDPSCLSCGAPATTASLMPPPPVGEIPDDPIDEVDPDDPEWHEDKAERMGVMREMASNLAKLVENAQLREDPERDRVFVTYTLQGHEFRAKIMRDYVGVRAVARGAKGDFFLLWSKEDAGGEVDESNVWRESERKVFFSKHCRVSSGHCTKEVARLASLPSDARAALTELCETFEGGAQLEDEALAIALGHAVHEQGVQLIVDVSAKLARIANAFPRDWSADDPTHYQLCSCKHCGWAYFLEAGQSRCSHCLAPGSSTPN